MRPSFFETPSHRLAYCAQNGTGPTVMFCSGFKSDMTGSKASALAAHCAKKDQAFLRFDYSGHGQSSGSFTQGTIGQWQEDALALLDHCTQGPVILVGSSMGGWLALLMAAKRAERICGILGIAAAPDFTERLIWQKLTAEQQKLLLSEGVFYAPACEGEAPYPITRQLIEEARQHLVLDRPRAISCPLHLLHGTEDEDVPISIAEIVAQQFPKTRLTRIEGGNHRLSTPENLEQICRHLDQLTALATTRD